MPWRINIVEGLTWDTIDLVYEDIEADNQGFSLGFWSLPQVEFHSNIFFQLGKLVHQLIPTVEIDSKRNSQYWEIDSQSNFHLWALITSLISISGN